MNNKFNVTKRDGRTQPFDLEKVHRVLEWATNDIAAVSISEIELRANIQLYDKFARKFSYLRIKQQSYFLLF